MKATGVVRKIDELGRIVLPIELRRNMDMNTGDSLEIYTTKDTVILKKYLPGCVFCGEIESVQDYKGKTICDVCIKEMVNIVG